MPPADTGPIRWWATGRCGCGWDVANAQAGKFTDTSTDNLDLPMSGLIPRTPTDVLRVRHSDSGDLPATAAHGLRAFYRQAPSRQHSWTSRPRRTSPWRRSTSPSCGPPPALSSPGSISCARPGTSTCGCDVTPVRRTPWGVPGSVSPATGQSALAVRRPRRPLLSWPITPRPSPTRAPRPAGGRAFREGRLRLGRNCLQTGVATRPR